MPLRFALHLGRFAWPAITVTQLSEAGVIAPGGDRYADVVGTVEEQVGRFRALADVGVQRVFVALHEDGTTEQTSGSPP